VLLLISLGQAEYEFSTLPIPKACSCTSLSHVCPWRSLEF